MSDMVSIEEELLELRRENSRLRREQEQQGIVRVMPPEITAVMPMQIEMKELLDAVMGKWPEDFVKVDLDMFAAAFAEFKPREIDFVPSRLRKVDAAKVYAHVFIGWIAPPFVPSVLALRREGEKEGLVVFFGWLFCGRLIPRCGLALVRHA